MIFLVKNQYNLIKKNDLTGIFGAFSKSEWIDYLGYMGNSQAFLFSISPKFRTFFTFNGKGGKNYCYMSTKQINNSKYKCGLGFGGDSDYDYFRLWLDKDLMNQSKSFDYGTTFEEGVLTEASDNYLKLISIEIWGFPEHDTKSK